MNRLSTLSVLSILSALIQGCNPFSIVCGASDWIYEATGTPGGGRCSQGFADTTGTVVNGKKPRRVRLEPTYVSTGGKPVEAIVTAYTSELGQTDSTPCVGPKNVNLCERYGRGEKICAVGDRSIPLGTKIKVPGYGTCTALDRMNKRFDPGHGYNGPLKIDVYMGSDTPAARQWGVKRTRIAMK